MMKAPSSWPMCPWGWTTWNPQEFGASSEKILMVFPLPSWFARACVPNCQTLNTHVQYFWRPRLGTSKTSSGDVDILGESNIRHFNELKQTGWWFEPLWNILVSWGYNIPNIWKVIKHVPNHQPANHRVFDLRNAPFFHLPQMAPESMCHSRAGGSRLAIRWPRWSFWLKMAVTGVHESKWNSWRWLLGIYP